MKEGMRKILHAIGALAVLGIIAFALALFGGNFATPQAPVINFEECAVAGCSGQLCVEASEAPGIITTCEYRPEYTCYQNARCERQIDKQCGWTQTQELLTCLKNPPAL
jgi:eight-cysteine-cluster-containing protein